MDSMSSRGDAKRVIDLERCDWFMKSDITVGEISTNFPPPESRFDPLTSDGKINFFWDGLDPTKDELLKNSRKRPLDADWMCGICYAWTRTKEELSEHMKNVHEGVARFHVCKTCGKRYLAKFLLLRHQETHKYDPKYPHSSYVNSRGVPVKEFVEKHYLYGVKPGRPTVATIAEAAATFNELANLKFQCISCPLIYEASDDLMDHYKDVHATIICKICEDYDKEYRKFSELKTHLIRFHGLEYLKGFDQGYSKIWRRISAEREFRVTGEPLVKFFHSYAKHPLDMPWRTLKTLEIAARRKHMQTEDTHKVQDALQHDENIANSAHNSDASDQNIHPNASEHSNAIEQDEPNPAQLCTVSIEEAPGPEEEEPEEITREEEVRNGIFSSRTRKLGAPRRSCYVCKKLVTYSAFQRHIDAHSELKFNCPEEGCRKRFLTQGSLLLHQRAHSNERPFKCSKCPRAYNYGSLLTRHMRTHTGENPYACDMCGKRFHELVSLNYHKKKIHTGERPHRCTECNKGFILASDLKKHANSHKRSNDKVKSAVAPAIPKCDRVRDGLEAENVYQGLPGQKLQAQSTNGKLLTFLGSNDTNPVQLEFVSFGENSLALVPRRPTL